MNAILYQLKPLHSQHNSWHKTVETKAWSNVSFTCSCQWTELSASLDINHVRWWWILLKSWSGSLGPGRGASPVCVRECMCTAPHAKFLPHYLYCLWLGPESTKEGLRPLPLTLQAARVAYFFCLTGKHGWEQHVYPHMEGVYSLLIVLPWHPCGLSLRLVYTGVCLPCAWECRGGSSCQLTPGKPIGESHGVADVPVFNGADRNILLDESLLQGATCTFLMESRTKHGSLFYKDSLSDIFTLTTCWVRVSSLIWTKMQHCTSR